MPVLVRSDTTGRHRPLQVMSIDGKDRDIVIEVPPLGIPHDKVDRDSRWRININEHPEVTVVCGRACVMQRFTNAVAFGP